MHLLNFTNVFDLTNVFAKINAFVLCTNAFATEAYHFKANVLAVLSHVLLLCLCFLETIK